MPMERPIHQMQSDPECRRPLSSASAIGCATNMIESPVMAFTPLAAVCSAGVFPALEYLPDCSLHLDTNRR